MSENKIKFIVDDLADYTGSLLNYCDNIVYLPKRILVNNIEKRTTNTYNSSLMQADGLSPYYIYYDEYVELLQKFTDTFEDYDFIYLKPYTYGLFDRDLNNLTKIIKDKFSQIHIVETDHYGSALHLLTELALKKYTLDKCSLSELVSYVTEANKHIFSYVNTSPITSTKNKWPMDYDNTCYVYKMSGRTMEEIEIAEKGKDSIDFFEKFVLKVTGDIGSYIDFKACGTTFPFLAGLVEYGEHFLNDHLPKGKDIRVYKKSQSCCTIDNDGDQLAFYII